MTLLKMNWSDTNDWQRTIREKIERLGMVEAEALAGYLHLAFKKSLISEYISLILRLLIRNNYNEILKI